MAAVSLQTALRSVERGELEFVYYLTGPEDILKDEFVSHVVDRVLEPEARDFNLDHRSAADLGAESLVALLETPPMLTERRVAVIRQLEAWRGNSTGFKTLLRYLEDPSPSTVAILIHGPEHEADPRVAELATHVTCELDGVRGAQSWVEQRASRRGVSVDKEAIGHLVRAVSGNLSALASEIDKLSAAALGDTITIADVETMVGVRRGETLADWIDATLARDLKRSVELVDVVLPQSGVTAVRMLMTLGTALVGTRLARTLHDLGQAPSQQQRGMFDALKRARARGIGRYADEVKRWTRAATTWSARELDEAIRLVYQADRQLKSTTVSDDRSTLHNMLVHIGCMKRAA